MPIWINATPISATRLTIRSKMREEKLKTILIAKFCKCPFIQSSQWCAILTRNTDCDCNDDQCKRCYRIWKQQQQQQGQNRISLGLFEKDLSQLTIRRCLDAFSRLRSFRHFLNGKRYKRPPFPLQLYQLYRFILVLCSPAQVSDRPLAAWPTPRWNLSFQAPPPALQAAPGSPRLTSGTLRSGPLAASPYPLKETTCLWI